MKNIGIDNEFKSTGFNHVKHLLTEPDKDKPSNVIGNYRLGNF